jgi:hypothetical protein
VLVKSRANLSVMFGYVACIFFCVSSRQVSNLCQYSLQFFNSENFTIRILNFSYTFPLLPFQLSLSFSLYRYQLSTIINYLHLPLFVLFSHSLLFFFFFSLSLSISLSLSVSYLCVSISIISRLSFYIACIHSLYCIPFPLQLIRLRCIFLNSSLPCAVALPSALNFPAIFSLRCTYLTP